MANQIFACALLFSVVCAVFCAIATPSIVTWLGAKEETWQHSKTYLQLATAEPIPFVGNVIKLLILLPIPYAAIAWVPYFKTFLLIKRKPNCIVLPPIAVAAIVRIFSKDAEVVAMAADFLSIMAFWCFANGAFLYYVFILFLLQYPVRYTI